MFKIKWSIFYKSTIVLLYALLQKRAAQSCDNFYLSTFCGKIKSWFNFRTEIELHNNKFSGKKTIAIYLLYSAHVHANIFLEKIYVLYNIIITYYMYVWVLLKYWEQKEEKTWMNSHWRPTLKPNEIRIVWEEAQESKKQVDLVLLGSKLMQAWFDKNNI